MSWPVVVYFAFVFDSQCHFPFTTSFSWAPLALLHGNVDIHTPFANPCISSRKVIIRNPNLYQSQLSLHWRWCLCGCCAVPAGGAPMASLENQYPGPTTPHSCSGMFGGMPHVRVLSKTKKKGASGCDGGCYKQSIGSVACVWLVVGQENACEGDEVCGGGNRWPNRQATDECGSNRKCCIQQCHEAGRHCTTI